MESSGTEFECERNVSGLAVSFPFPSGDNRGQMASRVFDQSFYSVALLLVGIARPLPGSAADEDENRSRFTWRHEARSRECEYTVTRWVPTSKGARYKVEIFSLCWKPHGSSLLGVPSVVERYARRPRFLP